MMPSLLFGRDVSTLARRSAPRAKPRLSCNEAPLSARHHSGRLIRLIHGRLMLADAVPLDGAVAEIRLDSVSMEDVDTVTVARLRLTDLPRRRRDHHIAFVLKAAVLPQERYALTAELRLGRRERLAPDDYRTTERVEWRASHDRRCIELHLRRIS